LGYSTNDSLLLQKPCNLYDSPLKIALIAQRIGKDKKQRFIMVGMVYTKKGLT
jgi:hypothetical protein